MNNANCLTKYSRLRASVWGDLLFNYLDTHQRPQCIDVRRKDGDLALQIDLYDAEHLAGYGMVAGYVSGDVLRYLILLVPKATVIRVLRMDPPRAGETTPTPRSQSLEYSRYINIRNVKLGFLGGFHKFRANQYPRVENIRVDEKGKRTDISRREVA